MRRFRFLLVPLLMLLSASLARAQYNIPQAPDMCGPGYYSPNYCGHVYGPGYCVYPPFPPFQGMVYGPKAPCPGSYYAQHPPAAPAAGPLGSPTFATHPYARSPRDFFMVYDPQ